MHSPFLVAAATAAIAGYVSRYSPYFLSLLLLTFACFCALIGFFLAPWYLKVLILLSALVWVQWLCRRTDCNSVSEDT
jgi:hypothetical protein